MAIEIFDQFGGITAATLSAITPEHIAELSEPGQRCLLTLIDAVDAKTSAGERVATARKRYNDAIANEAVKLQAHTDASMIIPFTVAKIEADLGRHLNAEEMQEARRAHDVRCREELADRERRAASAAYIPQ